MELGWPILYVALVWFISTGLIIWLDNRPAETYGGSLLGATFVAGFAVCGLLVTRDNPSVVGAYAAFAVATVIWGWHEMSFLMGFVSGPNRNVCPPGLEGSARFKAAFSTLIHHEVCLAATALLLYGLTWGYPNMLAAHVFGLLFVMRLSTKLNIFLGVRNFTADIMPPHLVYLKSYFKTAPMNALFPFSLAASTWTMWYFLTSAMAAPAGSGAAASATMMFTLVALALLEHGFLMIPFRDSALWDWARSRRLASPSNIERR